jgi:hypothetical protein
MEAEDRKEMGMKAFCDKKIQIDTEPAFSMEGMKAFFEKKFK